MTSAVDTNALFALLFEDEYTDTSKAELRRAYTEGRVVIIGLQSQCHPFRDQMKD